MIPEAGHYGRGVNHGQRAAAAIRANVAAFWQRLGGLGYSRDEILRAAAHLEGTFTPSILKEILGIADGCGLAYADMLAFNLYEGLAFPEECTVMMAVGDVAPGGRTLFLKNSDQVGSERMAGTNFHMNKEIYVVQLSMAGHRRFVGLSAAGSTAVKVAVNDKGVVTGSNIARTIELAQRQVDVAAVRASDRGQLMREGLAEITAMAAAQRVAAKLMERPTSTPGNIEFADAREGWIIEGSYDRLAVTVIRDGWAARANRFELMHELNSPEDVSSAHRYLRACQLLAEHVDRLSMEKFIEFSQDHVDGPGLNSICRHSDNYRDETSLGAAVVEIDGEMPERSRIAIALGKPCQAWGHPQGWILLEAGGDASQVPVGFLDGSAWKRFYTEEPRPGDPVSVHLVGRR